MQKTIQGQQLNQQSLFSFKVLFHELTPPDPADLHGRYQAEFVGPGWLRRAAGPVLSLAGLRGWWGKEFDGLGHGTNLVQVGNELKRLLPMILVAMTSLVDGRPGIALTYSAGSPLPWPWIIDEIRWLDNNTLLGLTMITRGNLHHLAFPFLLHGQA